MMLNEFFSFLRVRRFQMLRVPLQLLPSPERHIPQQLRFAERSGIIKTARRLAARFARFDPFLMMADRIWNLYRQLGRLVYADQLMTSVIRNQPAFAADKEHAALPFIRQ